MERSYLVCVASFDLQRDFIVERHARVKRDSKRATREPLTSSNGRRVSAGRYDEGVIVFTLLIRVAFNGPWSFAIVICPRPRFCIEASFLHPFSTNLLSRKPLIVYHKYRVYMPDNGNR